MLRDSRFAAARVIGFAALAALFALAPGSAFAVHEAYSTVAVDAPDGGSGLMLTGITPAGTLIGYYQPPGTYNEHAIVLDPDDRSYFDIGSLGGSSTYALAVNASGQMTGWSMLAGNVYTHAFETQSGGYGIADLGAAAAPYVMSSGQAINGAGDVAGEVQAPGQYCAGLATNQLAFVWTPATGIKELDLFGSCLASAQGINDRRQVAGWFYDAHANPHAFVTGEDVKGVTVIRAPGGDSGLALAINQRGRVVGQLNIGAVAYGFVTGSEGAGVTLL